MLSSVKESVTETGLASTKLVSWLTRRKGRVPKDRINISASSGDNTFNLDIIPSKEYRYPL
jgi:hypothetical protein